MRVPGRRLRGIQGAHFQGGWSSEEPGSNDPGSDIAWGPAAGDHTAANGARPGSRAYATTVCSAATVSAVVLSEPYSTTFSAPVLAASAKVS